MLIWNSDETVSANVTIDYFDASLCNEMNAELDDWENEYETGYYWVFCESGCIPNSDYIGAYETAKDCIDAVIEYLDTHYC